MSCPGQGVLNLVTIMFLQILPAHKSPVTAVAFAPDAKFLASYSLKDNQLLFFQVFLRSITIISVTRAY